MIIHVNLFLKSLQYRNIIFFQFTGHSPSALELRFLCLQLHPFYSHSMSWTPVRIVHAHVTHPKLSGEGIMVSGQRICPRYDLLGKQLVWHAHFAQEQHYVGGNFCDGRGFCKRFSWLCGACSVIKSITNLTMTCRYCSSIFLGATFLIVQHLKWSIRLSASSWLCTLSK